MSTDIWKTTILSDPDHEHLVAEIYYRNQFVALLDREAGREHVHITVQGARGSDGPQMPLRDFIDALQRAASNLVK
jgi:hypothetical protein